MTKLTREQITAIEVAAHNLQVAGGGHSMSMGRTPHRRFNEMTGKEYWTEQEQATYRCSNEKMSAILKLIELAPQIERLTTALENARKDVWLECREEAAKVHEPNCSCEHPCDDYWIWPSSCHKKAAAVIRSLTPPTEKAKG